MHYRIRHDRGHRDGDALIVSTRWDCGVCGAENHADDVFCWVCSAEHGDWQCPCGRKNRKAERECSECGRAKADE